ncbi:hypothetical protein T4B_14076, partial [Trichinella pseudospiralis]
MYVIKIGINKLLPQYLRHKVMAQCLKISLFSLLLLNGCSKMEKTVQRIFSDVVNAINDESAFVGKVFGKIEQRSGRSRYQAAIFLA